MEDFIDVSQNVPQERISKRRLEVDKTAPQTREEIVEAVRIKPQEQVQKRTEKQIVKTFGEDNDYSYGFFVLMNEVSYLQFFLQIPCSAANCL